MRCISTTSATCPGISGLNYHDNGRWARQILDDCDILGEAQFVGDDVVAQTAAFAGAPGIVYIAGTGSKVLGVTEAGAEVSNFDFGHSADGSEAGTLVWDVLVRAAAGETTAEDHNWLSGVLSALAVRDIAGLRAAMQADDLQERAASLAPAVTAGAHAGVRLPRTVCDSAAEELVRGVRLVVPAFAERPVRVAPAGGVACSAYMRERVAALLLPSPECRWQDPAYPPVIGAAILALRRFGFDPGHEVFRRLAGALPIA